VTHYEVLGVATTAPAEDVRRAYLRLAREHHPDRHGTGPSVRAEAAEERMRAVNAAWVVLGDPVRRSAYDRTLTLGPSDIAAGAGTGGPVQQPSTDFRPLFDDDEDDDDSWRYEPDEYDPRTGLGRWLAVGPPLLVVAGLALLAASLVIGLRALAAVALACLLLAGVMFLGAPMVALFKSQIHEGRPSGGPRTPR
jgi:hypothetical protein